MLVYIFTFAFHLFVLTFFKALMFSSFLKKSRVEKIFFGFWVIKGCFQVLELLGVVFKVYLL
jgi:hypothetical protein